MSIKTGVGWEWALALPGEYDGSIYVVVAMWPVATITVAMCGATHLLHQSYSAYC